MATEDIYGLNEYGVLQPINPRYKSYFPAQQPPSPTPGALAPVQVFPEASEIRRAAPASPTAAAVSAATANPFVDRPNPLTTDQSLYTPIVTPVQEPFDFSKYKRPEAPRFLMPGPMPQRDIAMERRQIARGSLRSALLGALLGGGAGALGAMTGAQQGMQQAYDQQYGQEMADYENRLRMIDLQNKQALADYDRQEQERRSLIGEALQTYQQQGLAKTVAAQNEDALRRGRLAFAEAVASGDKERARQIENVMSNVVKIAPADQARFIQFGLTGDAKFAEGGFRPAGNEQAISPYFSALRNAQTTWLKQHEVPMDPAAYAADAYQWNQSIDADMTLPENAKALLKVPVVQQRTLGVARLGETKRGAQAREQGAAESRAETKRRNDEIARHNLAMEGIRRDAVAVSRISANAAAKRAAGKPATYSKESNKTIIDGFNKIRDEVAQMERALSKPGAQIDAIGGGYRARLEELRAQLKTYPAQFPEYEFAGLDSGVPTIRPKKGTVVSPASPNPPAPANDTGTFREFVIDGQKVRVRVR